jgi:hypothetical protein
MKKTEEESYQTKYQRKKYAPTKERIAEKRKKEFFARYPNWKTQKKDLTDKEIFIISSYYGLEAPKLLNKEIAKELNITTQWLHTQRKRIEAKLGN